MKLNSSELPKTYDALVRHHPLLAIHDGVSYEKAMELVHALSDLHEPTPDQEKYLETLAILVEAYEDNAYPMSEGGGPLEVLAHLVEEHGMNASDLGRLLGERSLDSKILAGERGLSKANIRKLANHFGVSADLFL